MKEILELIENVDPADTAKLDEIDARVHVYVENAKNIDFGDLLEAKKHYKNGALEYTRSRDALKAIRPDGAIFEIANQGEYLQAEISILGSDIETCHRFFGKNLNEELAELHAIIQAIDYERGGKC